MYGVLVVHYFFYGSVTLTFLLPILSPFSISPVRAGALKQCKAKGPCTWVGCTGRPTPAKVEISCKVDKTCGNHIPVCPAGYSPQYTVPCMKYGKATQKFRHFCCKQNYNYTDSRFSYLTPLDYKNAKEFRNIKIDQIPLPYVRTSPVKTRNAYNDPKKWPGAVAPYTIDPTFSEKERAEVAKAIQNYQENTCFQFVPLCVRDTSWVSIENDEEGETGSSCGVTEVCGPQGGRQYVKLDRRCRNAEWFIHELGHSICFSHEQDRFDRDDFIFFDTNVAGCEATPRNTQDQYTTLDLPFDFYSSQMYPGCRKGNCIQRKVGSGRCGNLWNGSGRLSTLDIRKINRFYDCDCDKYNC